VSSSAEPDATDPSDDPSASGPDLPLEVAAAEAMAESAPVSDATPDLATRIVFALSERSETVAFAESLTGGLLTAAVVAVPGASAVLRGGVVAYATELKYRLLGVDHGLLAERGPVDAEVASAMATGAAERLGATWAVSTTGVAGPGPAEGSPAGRVFLGLTGPGRPAQARELSLAGDRSQVRAGAVQEALAWLASAVGATEPARAR
jgi:nicotinamide-nucleotide amidase